MVVGPGADLGRAYRHFPVPSHHCIRPAETGMSEHSIFAPSKAAMWMACPGSMAFPENQVQDSDGGQFAAEGSAAHVLASRALDTYHDCAFYLGETIQIGERVFNVTDEMVMYVQVYVDYVRDPAAKGHM